MSCPDEMEGPRDEGKMEGPRGGDEMEGPRGEGTKGMQEKPRTLVGD